jgi:hypothetical protein
MPIVQSEWIRSLGADTYSFGGGDGEVNVFWRSNSHRRNRLLRRCAIMIRDSVLACVWHYIPGLTTLAGILLVAVWEERADVDSLNRCLLHRIDPLTVYEQTGLQKQFSSVHCSETFDNIPGVECGTFLIRGSVEVVSESARHSCVLIRRDMYALAACASLRVFILPSETRLTNAWQKETDYKSENLRVNHCIPGH